MKVTGVEGVRKDVEGQERWCGSASSALVRAAIVSSLYRVMSGSQGMRRGDHSMRAMTEGGRRTRQCSGDVEC